MRVAELRRQGTELQKRPRGRPRGNPKWQPRLDEIALAELTTRTDDEGRVITVCPPRWARGVGPSRNVGGGA